jgi:hypothetical protein
MRRTIQLLIVTCTFALMFSAAIHAAEGDAKADQRDDKAALEAKIVALKQQIDALHDELYDLQRKLAVLDTTSGTSPAATDPIIARASQTMPPVSETTSEVTPEGDNEAKPEKPFRSGADIVKRIPVELIPKPEEMTDRFKVQDINNWLESEIIGKKVQVGGKLNQVRLHENYSIATTADNRWLLDFSVAEPETRFRTVQVAPTYSRARYEPSLQRYFPTMMQYKGDREFGKAVAKVEDGHSVAIAGTIRTIRLNHTGHGRSLRWTLHMSLDDLTVDNDRLRKYSDNLVKD